MKNQKPGLENLKAMLSKAEHKLASAQREFEMGFVSDSASRAYYAAYHAISAVLAHHGLTFSSHAQLLGAFNRGFVKTGIFPPDTFKKLQRMFLDRNIADYQISKTVSRQVAEKDIANAKLLVEACREYLEKKTGHKFSAA
ncbi:MAG TPA: HEPN domain-containing protein [bacterium]|nr:HEPN domain-containing protein [bacterium]